MAKLTGAACRAGRALLGWSMRDLKRESGVSLPTIQKIEAGGAFYESTAQKIVHAFETHFVEITNGSGTGARLRMNRGDLHNAMQELIADFARGRRVRGDALAICQIVANDERASADQLPGDCRDLLDEFDEESPPATYGQAAALMLRSLAPAADGD